VSHAQPFLPATLHSFPREQLRLTPGRRDQFDRSLIEARKNGPSRASTFESDHAIGEIASLLENGETGFDGGTIDYDGRAFTPRGEADHEYLLLQRNR
jgi:hypothetical protein